MKRSRIKQRPSHKKVAYDEEFAEAKVLVKERSKGVCEAATFVLYNLHRTPETAEALQIFLDVPCGFHAVHVHHRKYRSRGGSNNLTNLNDLCEAHHSWAHAHGGFGEPANLLGLSLSAGELEVW
jgi:5-methylcytosine-specific restriction endonuclease McrA